MSIKSISPVINTYSQVESPITQLPLHIARVLFSFCEGNEVAKLGRVCRNFRVVADNEQLWKLLFIQDFPYHTSIEAISYREQYKLRFLIERNWDQAKCSPKTVPLEICYPLAVLQNLIVSGGPHGGFQIYDKNTLEHLHSCEEHRCSDLEGFQDDGDYLISIENGGPTGGVGIKVWRKETGRCISRIQDCITFLVDNNQIFGSKIDMPTFPNYQFGIVVWDKLTGNTVRTLEPTQGTKAIAMDDNYFFAGMQDGTIKAWLKSDCSFIGSFDCGKNDRVSALLEVNDLLISGHKSGAVRIWSKKERKVIQELIDPETKDLEPVDDLKREAGFLICKGSKFIRIWSENSNTLLCKINDCYAYVFYHDILYVGLAKGQIEARDKETGLIRFQLQSPTEDRVFKIKISGNHLVVDTSKSKELWNLKTKQLIKVFSDIREFYLEGDRIIATAKEGLKIYDFSVMKGSED